MKFTLLNAIGKEGDLEVYADSFNINEELKSVTFYKDKCVYAYFILQNLTSQVEKGSIYIGVMKGK